MKSVYVSTSDKAGGSFSTWKVNIDGSGLEKLVESCGVVMDADASGQYLLASVDRGERTGIYQISLTDRKCSLLLASVITVNTVFSRDGNAFLFAVTSRGNITFYRQTWRNGKIIGTPQVALKIPFAFPVEYRGNAYDFSRDLSTIVYARPGGHADLYYLNNINP